MTTRDQIVETVYAAIDELNMQLPEENRLVKALDTALFGEGGNLDSMGFINLVIAVEQEVQKHLGKSISLIGEAVLDSEDHPFRSVTTLADLIAGELDKSGDG